MLRLHHLDHSRSWRIVWLLEELGLAYETIEHARDPATRLAPPSLEAIHPLGKAPLLEDDGLVVFESGAMIDYVIRRHGGGRLTPDPASADHDRYQMWLHYAEGSAMLPVMIDHYARSRGGETPALRARVDDELARHFGFVDDALAGRDFLVGEGLTGADIQMAYVGELIERRYDGTRYPNIVRWMAGLRERAAYRRALEKGGPILLGGKTT